MPEWEGLAALITGMVLLGGGCVALWHYAPGWLNDLSYLPETATSADELDQMTARTPEMIANGRVGARLGLILSCGSVLLGFAVLASRLWAGLREMPVRHAQDDVLPEVPRQPLCESGTWCRGRAAHRLVRTGERWEMIPLHANPLRRRWPALLFFLAAIGLVLGAFYEAAPIGTLDGRTLYERALDGLLWFFAIAAVLLASWGMAWLWRCDARAARADRRSAVFTAQGAVLTRADVTGTSADEHLPVARILAVQLCAVRRSVADRFGRARCWAVECNLVLRPNDGAVPERRTLAVSRAVLATARQAATIADLLGVPLLNHARAEHWEAERVASSGRPPLPAGGNEW